MHVRPMLREDLPACVTILTAAYANDKFMQHLAPGLFDHPEGYRRYMASRIRSLAFAIGTTAVVCVKELPTGEEEVVGFATWIRYSSDPASPYAKSPYLRTNTSVLDYVEWFLDGIQETYTYTLKTNPAVDWDVIPAYRHSTPAPIFTPLKDRWHLRWLAVAPQHQRKGIGKLVVQWGLDRAREEGVALGLPPLPATLLGSPAGLKMYQGLGFRICAWVGEELGDDDAAGAVMVWDEEGRWMRARTVEDGMFTESGRPLEVVFRSQEGRDLLARADDGPTAS